MIYDVVSFLYILKIIFLQLSLGFYISFDFFFLVRTCMCEKYTLFNSSQE